jgi:hypothetical protein
MHRAIGIPLSAVPSQRPGHGPAGIDSLAMCWDAPLGPATAQRPPTV